MKPKINKWLSRKYHQIRFLHAFESTSLSVKMDLIEDDVRLIIDDFLKLKERTIFMQLYNVELKKVKPQQLSSVAKIYQTVLQKYNTIVEQYRQGN